MVTGGETAPARASRSTPLCFWRLPTNADFANVPTATMSPATILFFSALFIVFEGVQLIVAERHLGVKRIADGVDPRESGPSEQVAFAWSAGIVLYWLWMLAALLSPLGRIQVACMLTVSVLGGSLRRSCGLKWVLVILTLEGAVRIGMLTSLFASAWRSL